MEMEKYWDLMHYCVLMHREIPLFLHDSTNANATRQENDHLMHYCVLMHREILLFLHDSTNAYATRQENDHYV